MTLAQFLASEPVSGVLMAVGIPTCAFVIAYSARIRRDAVRSGARVRTIAYLLVASTGVAISLLGGFVASELSIIASMNASPDNVNSAPGEAFTATILLWPLGWSMLTGVALATGRDWLGPAARSLLAAVIAGFLGSVLIQPIILVIALASDGSCCPVNRWAEQFGGPMRVLCFLAFLAIAVGISVMTLRENRAHVEG